MKQMKKTLFLVAMFFLLGLSPAFLIAQEINETQELGEIERDEEEVSEVIGEEEEGEKVDDEEEGEEKEEEDEEREVSEEVDVEEDIEEVEKRDIAEGVEGVDELVVRGIRGSIISARERKNVKKVG